MSAERRPSRSRRRQRAVLVVAALAAVLATGLAGQGARSEAAVVRPASPTAAGALPARPNIVFVLADDLSRNLVPYMPNVRALARQGTTFANATVTDSLCCPSRASIFTGLYPHNTHVVTNVGEHGGFLAFHTERLERRTFAAYLHDAGYRTALLGKYLNFYDPDQTFYAQQPYVPPGWDDWVVAGDGYQQYDYDLTEDGASVHHGSAPEDYLTDVLGRSAKRFIAESAAADQPFLLELSTFSPHAPATPAPVDATSFAGLKAPRPASYDAPVRHAPAWLAGRTSLTRSEVAQLDQRFRNRVRSVQSIDRVIARIRMILEETGEAGRTIIVFSSDNGFHIGQYRLTLGKETAFDSDLMVPLVVAGPGIRKNAVVPDLVQTVDLAPTFLELAGAGDEPAMDGRSLVGLLTGPGTPQGWRTATLSEHTRPAPSADDPDQAPAGGGNPPSYRAMRTDRYTYVEYDTGEHELYDRQHDPSELDNIYDETAADGAPRVPAGARAALSAALARLVGCHGATSCGAAGAASHFGIAPPSGG